MDKQIDFIDATRPEHRALSRRSDPPTSHDAAVSLDGSLPDLEARVLACLRKRWNGGTSHELAEALGLSLVTVSPRLRPLANRGLIVATTEKRKGASGRSSIVWKVKS